ncbi:DUF2852 domain-containing protein [Hyphomicrobium sp.]|uniref:DUF2852 domain-containing protein n=1 Tax=Hyphomicrobium sp. TaxID=82 RepID=UPI000F9D391F|nr:DUF2852 domain-containing protein [Hyphomicrobium sp.]RUO98346.1 MAG: DUF2852 domain-containing protein [Hyphomicrobium sp.]
MFHLHPLPPMFVMFHFIGVALLLITAIFVMRRVLRARCSRAGLNRRFDGARSGETGNRAFDEYRQTTLRTLEAEADEFRKYLDGLRRAADAAAFQAFLNSRRSGTGTLA